MLPSTASVIALKLVSSEKCLGCSRRGARMSSARCSPTFSMWYTAPDSTWYICPALTTNEENASAFPRIDTSTVPDTH